MPKYKIFVFLLSKTEQFFIYLNMAKFFINGKNRLCGEVEMDTAKNALLPILAGCIMVEGKVTLEKATAYTDVEAMCDILRALGGVAQRKGDDLEIDCSSLDKCELSHELASPVRSSIFTLGPLLARLGKAKVAYPGGCDIGLRPIDIHLSSLRQLGCKIVEKNGYIYAEKGKPLTREVFLSFQSVGATENIMMFCALLPGESKIYNSAKEPEIVDLARFLSCCGAKIEGAGTDVITITGVERLEGCRYRAISDRIECGTFLIAAAMTGGEVKLENAVSKHNSALIEKLKTCGCFIKEGDNEIFLSAPKRLESFVDVETAVYPGFPTDLQPQIVALASIAKGCSLVFENVFENRFNYVGELLKMGCDIRFKSSICIIRGKDKIFGADVVSTDLRGGAALVLAGLACEGYTTISRVEFIDRGYFHLEDKLAQLGADIKRI